MPSSDKTYGRWCRKVTTEKGDAKFRLSMETVEYLDMEAVLKRFVDATHERGDASLRDRLDYALNGDA